MIETVTDKLLLNWHKQNPKNLRPRTTQIPT